MLPKNSKVLNQPLLIAIVNLIRVHDCYPCIFKGLVQHVGAVLRRARFIARVGSVCGVGTTLTHLGISAAVCSCGPATTTVPSGEINGVEYRQHQSDERNKVKDC